MLGTAFLAVLAQLVLFVTMAWLTCKTKEDVQKLWRLFLEDAHLVVKDTGRELAEGAEEAKRLAQEHALMEERIRRLEEELARKKDD